MKVMQRLTMNAEYIYCSYAGLEINDAAGDEAVIGMTKEQYFELEEKIIAKCNRYREEDRRKAEEAAQAIEDKNSQYFNEENADG